MLVPVLGPDASMGPRPDDRGIRRTRSSIASAWSLEWGRDQMNRGIGYGQAVLPAGVQASIGPQSEDRGIIKIKDCTGKYFMLQWVRDQLIAEFYANFGQKYATN